MISASLSKYRAVFVIAFKQTWNNKANLSGLLFFLFILLFIYNRLWVVIGVQENANGLNATYIWYLLLAEIIILSGPKMERIMFDDIKSGNIAYYVNKPISFFLMRYIEGIGNMTVSFLIMGTFGTIVTLLLTGQPPFDGNQPFVLYRGRPVQPVAGKHPDPWHGNRTYGFYFRWCHFSAQYLSPLVCRNCTMDALLFRLLPQHQTGL